MENKFFGSKLNSVLLLVLIVLMVIAIRFMYKNKEVYLPVPEIPKEDPIPVPNSEPSPKPSPSPQLRTVIIGQEFTIQKGEKVIIAGTDGATFKLTGFYNNPCPPNANCIWSGLDILYEIQIPEIVTSDVTQEAKLYVKNEPLQHIDNVPFSAILKDSDYTTYAKIILQTEGQGN